MMVSTTMNPVVTKTHEAFSAAAGTTLVDGQVVGLHVSTDVNIPSMDLDLYTVEGFQARINPTWAMSLTRTELTELMQATIIDQLP